MQFINTKNIWIADKTDTEYTSLKTCLSNIMYTLFIGCKYN